MTCLSTSLLHMIDDDHFDVTIIIVFNVFSIFNKDIGFKSNKKRK